METFPELAKEPYENLSKLDEDWMKSADGKERWRKFIISYVLSVLLVSFFHAQDQIPPRYEKKIKDHNFGSLIRTDARDEYAEKNTIFGTSGNAFSGSSHTEFRAPQTQQLRVYRCLRNLCDVFFAHANTL